MREPFVVVETGYAGDNGRMRSRTNRLGIDPGNPGNLDFVF